VRESCLTMPGRRSGSGMPLYGGGPSSPGLCLLGVIGVLLGEAAIARIETL